MEVIEAWQLLLNYIENSSSCGRLDENIRKAKGIINSYINEKIVEDREKVDSSD